MTMLAKNAITSLLLSSLSAAAAAVEVPDSLSAPLNATLDQVVVTGTATHRRMVDSPIPVNVITARDIAATNATNLEEALTKLTPNMTFSTNAMGTETVINGLNSDYFLILVNGKKLVGDDALLRINVSRIRRIEILNNSAATLYGSDAIGGVLNIITDEPKQRVEVSSQTSVRSKDRISESANLNLHLGRLTSATSYHFNHADSWQLSPYEEKVSKGESSFVETTKVAATGYRSHNATQEFTYAANSRLKLNAHGQYYDYLTDRNVADYKYNLLHRSYQYGAGLRYMLGRKDYLTADFHSDNYTSSYKYIAESGDFQPGDVQRRKELHYYRGNVRGVFHLADFNKLVGGVEYVDEVLKSQSDNIDKETQYTLSLYAQDEWTFNRHWQAIIGGRYVDNETFGGYFTPNASAMYSLGGFRARLTYATGFRTPSLSEIYATDVAKTTNRLTIGNIDLQPEKSHNVALNAEYNHRYFSLSATGYYNKVKDMINYRTLSDAEVAAHPDWAEYNEVRQRDNIDRARIKGLTVNASVYPGAGFTLKGGYSYTDANNLETGNPVDKTVKHSGFVSADWTHRFSSAYQLGVNIAGRGQGKRYSETYDYRSPGFMMWDITTHHEFTLSALRMNVGLGIENIFDKTSNWAYYTKKPYSSINPGRSGFVSVALYFTR
jgi:outer membrane receptor for ferrienterochelin and colicins